MLTMTILGEAARQGIRQSIPQPIDGPCLTAAECRPGLSCQGSNCQGKCRPMVMQAPSIGSSKLWCLCDGKTFYGAQPELYAHEGACPGALLPVQAPCKTGSECATGWCRGANCQGKCVPMIVGDYGSAVMTKWCGCDGKTFTSGSSNEPYLVYAHKGACEEAAPPPSPPVPPPPAPSSKWKVLLAIGIAFAAVGTGAGVVYWRRSKKHTAA